MAPLTRTRPRTRTVPGMALMPAHWRAALIVLTAAFPRDDDVWACVTPGVAMDLRPAMRARTDERDRLLLAFADGLVSAPAVIDVDTLVGLDDPRLRLVLDALAVARGSLPVD